MTDPTITQPPAKPPTLESLIETLRIAFGQEGFSGFQKFSIIGNYGKSKVTLSYDLRKELARAQGGAQ